MPPKLRVIDRAAGSDPYTVSGLPCPHCGRHAVRASRMGPEQRRELERELGDPIPPRTVKGRPRCGACNHVLDEQEIGSLLPLIFPPGWHRGVR